jgi:serine/threonine-protein kinase
MVLGTPRYMAPEQADGRIKDIGPATDVYALGAILYELLTGQPAFPGKDPRETLRQVSSLDPPPRVLQRQVPPELEAVCLKCLQKKPQDRYAAAAELSVELRHWLKGEPTRARPPSRLHRCWRMVRRHSLLSGSAAAILLATIVGLAAWHYLDPERPVQQLEDQLARKEPITLLDEKGRLRWSRWALRQGILEEAGVPPKVFALRSGAGAGITLLELIRDPQLDRFRYSAEVLHREGERMGGVGIYFNHTEQVTDQAKQMAFAVFSFNDQRSLPGVPPVKVPGTSVVFYLHAHHEKTAQDGNGQPRRVTDDMSGPPLHQMTVPPAGLTRKTIPWRKLAVEVRPESITCFWEGMLLAVVTRERILNVSATVLQKRLTFHPVYPPRGGLGLAVSGGEAFYRNLKIEPLPE